MQNEKLNFSIPFEKEPIYPILAQIVYNYNNLKGGCQCGYGYDSKYHYNGEWILMKGKQKNNGNIIDKIKQKINKKKDWEKEEYITVQELVDLDILEEVKYNNEIRTIVSDKGKLFVESSLVGAFTDYVEYKSLLSKKPNPVGVDVILYLYENKATNYSTMRNELEKIYKEHGIEKHNDLQIKAAVKYLFNNDYICENGLSILHTPDERLKLELEASDNQTVEEFRKKLEKDHPTFKAGDILSINNDRIYFVNQCALISLRYINKAIEIVNK